MTAADSDAGSDIDDCPISLEPYAERGPHQPLFLPECGHTFSRVAIERLLERLRDTEKPGARAVLECPLCNTAQPCVHDVGSCKPNWNLIERITTSRATRARQRRQQQAATPPAPAPPPPSPPPQICWPHDASALDAEAAAQVLAVDTAPGILSASLTEHATDAERAANRRALGCALLERVRAPLGALFAPEAAEALARKVTGMLLWRDTDDVLGMLSRPDDLFAHCRDAMLELQKSDAGVPQAAAAAAAAAEGERLHGDALVGTQNAAHQVLRAALHALYADEAHLDAVCCKVTGMLVHSFTDADELRGVLLDAPLFLEQACTAIAMLRRTYAGGAAPGEADSANLGQVFAAEAAAEAAAGPAAPLAELLTEAARGLLAQLYGEDDAAAVAGMAAGVAEALLYRAEPDTVLALVADGGAEALAARVDATVTWLAAAASADPGDAGAAYAPLPPQSEPSPLEPLERLFGSAATLADAAPAAPGGDATPPIIQQLMTEPRAAPAAQVPGNAGSRPPPRAAPPAARPHAPAVAAPCPAPPHPGMPPGFTHPGAPGPAPVFLPNGMPVLRLARPMLSQATVPLPAAPPPVPPGARPPPQPLDVATGAAYRALKDSLAHRGADKHAPPPAAHAEAWRHGGGPHDTWQARHSYVDLNSDGYPLRPGQRECRFYMENGFCKFRHKCRWHHPDPRGAREAAAVPGAPLYAVRYR